MPSRSRLPDATATAEARGDRVRIVVHKAPSGWNEGFLYEFTAEEFAAFLESGVVALKLSRVAAVAKTETQPAKKSIAESGGG